MYLDQCSVFLSKSDPQLSSPETLGCDLEGTDTKNATYNAAFLGQKEMR